MKIRRGTTRVVFILFGIVFKFPALKQSTVHGRLFHYMRGVIANASEFATYIMCERVSFLVPIFSLGFISIQKYQDGERPTWEEMEQIIRKLPEKARIVLMSMDNHPFTPQNFRHTKEGLKMIDFGDGFSEGYPLSYFLRQFHKEFGEVLK